MRGGIIFVAFMGSMLLVAALTAKGDAGPVDLCTLAKNHFNQFNSTAEKEAFYSRPLRGAGSHLAQRSRD
jgi:hypothetical protein